MDEPAITTDLQRTAFISLNGCEARVEVKATEKGARLEITPTNCNAEGTEPGVYELTPAT